MKGLLRWYPVAWRERYGDEMVACLEDQLEGRTPGVGLRFSLAARGLGERARCVVLPGRSIGGDPVRDGSLAVLCAFAIFCWAGLSFQKLTEHFASSMPPGTQALPNGVLTAVQGLGLVASAAVLAGMAVAVPSVVAYLRSGRWREIRRAAVSAVAVSLVVAAGVAVLAVWARHLSPAQRNGADVPYHWAFLALAVAVGAVFALWARFAVALARRIRLSRWVRHAGGVAAGVVALAMAVMTGLAALWWGAVAVSAPQLIDDGSRSPGALPVDPQLAVTMALMVGATALGACGVASIVRGRRSLVVS